MQKRAEDWAFGLPSGIEYITDGPVYGSCGESVDLLYFNARGHWNLVATAGFEAVLLL
jgi:hypothetical protein